MNEKKTKILVSVDGSDNSKRALLEAKKYAMATQAEVTILTVLEHTFALQYVPPKLVEVEEQGTREEVGKTILKKALKYFDDFDGEVYTTLRNGFPADQILEEAEFGEFDLIVMGSRGLGVFSRTFLGSVSNSVLNHTKANVLIVR